MTAPTPEEFERHLHEGPTLTATSEPEWCEDCGCPQFVAEWDWEVDVSRDGPDGPEWQLAILDCGHYMTTGRKRGQRYV